MSYHFTPVRMAKIKNTRNNKFGEDVEKRNTCVLSVGMQTGAATVENIMEVPKKVKNRIII